jgi:eukaryotic-like serine/threonine-protein kinase
MTGPASNDFAAEHLVGRELDGGWQVVKKIQPGPAATGGFFSVQYIVEDSSGRRAFCKVLDFGKILRATGIDPARVVQAMTEAFNFERDIVKKCARLSRVITGISDGVIMVGGYTYPAVNYIIFEEADHDIRQAMALSRDLEVATRLRIVHNIAAGIRQLHQWNIAHQDLKPSNAFVFGTGKNRSGKVGDLGRAFDPALPAPHDMASIPGDRQYAPPEQLYAASTGRTAEWRKLNDFYQLGALLTFVFVGVSMNALLVSELATDHHWDVWGDSFEEVLPYVQDAFGRAVTKAVKHSPPEIAELLERLVRALCNPDPTLRGFASRLGRRPSFDIERVVSELDLIARRTTLGVIRKAS